MVGANRCGIGFLIAVVLAFAGTPETRGQRAGDVPGGWSSDVGVQSFTSAASTGYGAYGAIGFTPGQLTPPLAMFYGASGAGAATLPQWQTPPQTTNNLVPLADLVRKSARKRSRR
jgi:hypothetical protein